MDFSQIMRVASLSSAQESSSSASCAVGPLPRSSRSALATSSLESHLRSTTPFLLRADADAEGTKGVGAQAGKGAVRGGEGERVFSQWGPHERSENEGKSNKKNNNVEDEEQEGEECEFHSPAHTAHVAAHTAHAAAHTVTTTTTPLSSSSPLSPSTSSSMVGGKRSRSSSTPESFRGPRHFSPAAENIAVVEEVKQTDSVPLVESVPAAIPVPEEVVGEDAMSRRRRGPSVRRFTGVPTAQPAHTAAPTAPTAPAQQEGESPMVIESDTTAEALSEKVNKMIKEANSAYDFSRWVDAYAIYSEIEKLTDNGHVFYRLGMMHLVGYHVARSTDISRVYFEKAYPHLMASAEQGDAEAQADLGYMYYNGHTPDGQNIATAIQYYTSASNQNYSRALCNLGYIFYNGQGKGDSVSSDIKLAVDYYRRAACSGSLVAHSNLGFIFKENNKEFKQDIPLALKHFFIASKGNEKAREQIQKALSGESGDELKTLAVSHLAQEWPCDHAMLHEGCKVAITEITYLSKCRFILPELAIEIIKKMIITWPENHGKKEISSQKEN